MLDTFEHGSPFYGSVVYLIPNTRASRDWWDRLARNRNHWMRSPKDLGLPWVDRTTCDGDGHFAFSKVHPGDYILHASVFWVAWGGESTEVCGRAWIGTTTVAASETVQVTLRPPEYVFKGDIRRTAPATRTVDSLPALGEFVYVEELPEAITKVPPEYPAAARREGVDGTVLIQVLVGRDGLVKDALIVRSIPMLDEAAEKAVRRWVFKPALARHKPVATWMAVPVHFSLR